MEPLGPTEIGGSGHHEPHSFLTLTDIVLHPGGEWTSAAEGMFLIFPKQGEPCCYAGRVTQPLAPGDVLIVNQSKGSTIRLLAKSRAVLKYFCIRIEQLYPLFSSEEIPLLQRVLSGLKGTRFYAAASVVAKECHTSLDELRSQAELRRRTDLLRVAAAILTEEFKAVRDDKPAKDRPAGYVRLQEHFASALQKLTAEDIQNLSVSELSKKFSLSRRHLNRLFQEQFGVSMGTLRM
jgi:AraC-like DNA-binding protein